MPPQNTLASQVKIKVDGTEIQQNVMDQLASLTVDQHSHLPGMFWIQVWNCWTMDLLTWSKRWKYWRKTPMARRCP